MPPRKKASGPPPVPELTTEVASGDFRRGLEALRDALAAAMKDASVGIKPQIAGQLRAVMKDLAELPPVEELTPIDQLAARRKGRLSTSDAAASS